MSKNTEPYQDRLKRMKESIEQNKHLLEEDFPDDVTYIGDPELIKQLNDDENSEQDVADDSKK